MTAPARHRLATQEGKNRFAKTTDQPDLIGQTPEEMAQIALWRSLNYFPTPPAAVRALIEAIGWTDGGREILDPAAGRGHIVETLEEYNHYVYAADLHDHGKDYVVADWLSDGDERDIDAQDAIIMNPPFGHKDDRVGRPTIADRFITKALIHAPDVFVFARLGFITPGIRTQTLRRHLDTMYVFCDRVPIALGRIARKGGATDYVWLHFKRDADSLSDPVIKFIPQGTLKHLWRKGDDRL